MSSGSSSKAGDDFRRASAGAAGLAAAREKRMKEGIGIGKRIWSLQSTLSKSLTLKKGNHNRETRRSFFFFLIDYINV